MNWEKVADSLSEEFESLVQRANAFRGDAEVQREMRTRAQIARMLSDALRAGMRLKTLAKIEEGEG